MTNILGKSAKRSESPPWRFSGRGLCIALLLILVCAAGARALRLEQYADRPFMHDVAGYTDKAASLSFAHPFSIEIEPMTVWLNRVSQGLGRSLGLDVNLSVRLGTLLLGLAAVLWLFFLARLWMGDAGALLAALYLALSPFLCVTDVSGGRDTPYLLFLTGFCYFCFAPRRRLWPRAAGMGIMAGLLCLTRINGLFIVIPVSAAALIQARGKDFWKPWLAVLAVAGLMVLPYLSFLWRQTGDILYNLNSRAHWHSAEDPAAHVVQSFWDMFFRELGLVKLCQRALTGMYLSLVGSTARDSFFAAKSLPWGLYLAPYLVYLLGMARALLKLRWQPFLMVLLATGPVWPLIAVGTDPRLLLGALPFMAVFLGLGGEMILGRLLPRGGEAPRLRP